MTSNCTYKIGDVALSCDINRITSSADYKRAVSSFNVGDGAFVYRSDKTWRYAVVTEVSRVPRPHITFTVNGEGSTKTLELRHWGKRVVRPIGSLGPMAQQKHLDSSNRTQATAPLECSYTSKCSDEAGALAGDESSNKPRLEQRAAGRSTFVFTALFEKTMKGATADESTGNGPLEAGRRVTSRDVDDDHDDSEQQPRRSRTASADDGRASSAPERNSRPPRSRRAIRSSTSGDGTPSTEVSVPSAKPSAVLLTPHRKVCRILGNSRGARRGHHTAVDDARQSATDAREGRRPGSPRAEGLNDREVMMKSAFAQLIAERKSSQ